MHIFGVSVVLVGDSYVSFSFKICQQLHVQISANFKHNVIVIIQKLTLNDIHVVSL